MSDAKPSHVFICRNYNHLLQAILFALSEKQKTAVFLCVDDFITSDRINLRDTDLIEFHTINHNRACRPIFFVIGDKKMTQDDILACRYLYDEDITVHAYSDAKPYSFFNRDDILMHDDGDTSYWRENGKLAHTEYYTTYRTVLQQLPADYDRKRDRKVKVWDHIDILKNLSDEDKETIKYIFQTPTFSPGEKSLLFLPRRTNNNDGIKSEARERLFKLSDELVADLEAEGWELWVKPHPGDDKIPDNRDGLRFIPAYLPVELLDWCLDAPFTAAVSVRSRCLDFVPTTVAKETYNAISCPAAKELTQGKHQDPAYIYIRGLQKIASKFLKNEERLNYWESLTTESN